MEVDIIKVVGIALIGCILGILLKKYMPNQAVLLVMLTGAVILLITVEALRPILSMVNELFTGMGMGSNYGKIVVQSLGICIIAGFAADSCRDAGESALANKVELACKIIITTLALPMFRDLIGVATEMIKG